MVWLLLSTNIIIIPQLSKRIKSSEMRVYYNPTFVGL